MVHMLFLFHHICLLIIVILNHLLFLQYDKCREEYDLLHKGKDKVLMRELNKYLVRPRKK